MQALPASLMTAHPRSSASKSNRHGSGNHLKYFKAFVLCLMDLMGDEKDELHDVAVLFGQMCGVCDDAGRVIPDPPEVFLIKFIRVR